MAELATIYQLKEKENEIQQQHEQIEALDALEDASETIEDVLEN